ncbi:GNAT family N-acetyltransferase [Plantactinospora sp. CA-290183]|uniref:GNAT family N-acetyltransferase n=1 Tax=Plantactinospora sp. CA-290183 TaxID=3240006 RepID=UPI003D945704
MNLVRIEHDRRALAGLLRRDPHLHAYELGDLDDFYWPYTSWYRLADLVALVYHGGGTPTLLALDRSGPPAALGELLTALVPLLPRRFYAHLSPGGEAVLARHFPVQEHGPHLKMALTDPGRLDRVAAEGEVLTGADLPELAALYDVAYPGNWFDRRMLETGHYVGVRRDGELLAVAGVHVWSREYRVSALGNVTTHPRARGRGLASAAVATLCRRLSKTVDHVTLNVKADNLAALAVYRRLGFTPAAEYAEFTFGAPA